MNSFDFLQVDPEEAARINTVEKTAKKKTRKDDPRFWKPTISNPQKEYQAKIRMLPRGLAGLQNKLGATIPQHVHYIKEPESGLYLTVKCRKTLGVNEKCPICEYNWAMWNTGREELKEKSLKRKANVTNIGNFLIKEDLMNPTFNGSIRLWEHTAKVNETLLAPTRVQEASTTGFKKKLEKFTPYSPVNGRDYIVLMQENPKNGFPTYDGSFWDDDGLSNLAGSNEEMMALLENCYDLSEFLDDVPSAEDLATRYAEFCQALEEKTAGQIPATIGKTSLPMGGHGTTTVGQQATNGNANAYFAPKVDVMSKTSTPVNVFDAPVPASAPKVALSKPVNTVNESSEYDIPFVETPSDMPSLDISSEEDDLPF